MQNTRLRGAFKEKELRKQMGERYITFKTRGHRLWLDSQTSRAGLIMTEFPDGDDGFRNFVDVSRLLS